MLTKKKQGFTLIEVIIIVLLVAIAIPAIIFPVYESSRQSYKSENYLNALYLAEGKIEELTRFKNISGFYRTVSKVQSNSFNDNISGFNRTVTYSSYSSWRGIFNVNVSKTGMEDIKIVTWFTHYSSL